MNARPPAAPDFWRELRDGVSEFANSPIEVVEIPERSSDVSTVYGANFEGLDGYPLFAYVSIPRGGNPAPLFQVPGYGSVTPVPSYERRERYVVMALCHRGQRLSDNEYSAAYPGLLTESLPNREAYRMKYVVADCLRGLDVLLNWDGIDTSRLAVDGNDIAALVAGIHPGISTAMVSSPLLFTGLVKRLAEPEDYPLQEFNDFKRDQPADWPLAIETLALFDPIATASQIRADVLVACSRQEEQAADALVGAVAGTGEVYVNTGRGHIDHKFREDWLADKSAVPRSDGPFLARDQANG